MKDKYPDRKVGIVTFTDQIDVIGDGFMDIMVIGAEDMGDYNYLLKNGIASAST